MINRSLIAVAGLTAAALAAPASAQMSLSSAYIGGSLGQSKFKVDCGGVTTCDTKDTAFRIFGGYQVNRNFAAELGWAKLGKAHFADSGGSADLEASAFDLSALGAFPLGSQFSVFGRLGFYLSKAEFSGDATGSKNSNGITWGFGGQFDLNRNLGLRAEWQRYNKVKAQESGGTEDKGDIDALSIGVLWRFQ